MQPGSGACHRHRGGAHRFPSSEVLLVATPAGSSIRRTCVAIALALVGPVAAFAGGLHAQGPRPARRAVPTYTERYRPQYHFTPAKNWMNDPNGMVRHLGEYHLFYQYNPFGVTWGHMSWGHAVSPDLVRWQHLPVAIPEADGEMAFSGSAVVDHHNTSGFATSDAPPMVAIYTGYRPDRENNQSQHLAFSNDRGRTWTRYIGNPVLDIGSPEFRDPKVFWYEPQRRWVMVVSMAKEHRIRFYGSPDLKQWTLLSDFGPAGATGGVWECPDLFPLPIDGDSTKRRWVLVVNINPGAPAGGSGAQYFVGSFDGTRFIADRDAAGTIPTLWADWGKDFYAGVSWDGATLPDGRRPWLGWMSNWLYADRTPTAPWRSAQSLPRLLSLRTTPEGLRLVQEPVRELRKLRGAPRRIGPRAIAPSTTSLVPFGVRGRALEIVAEFEAGTASEFGLEVRVGPNQRTLVGVDPRASTVFVDRTRSGDASFHPEFAGRHAAPVPMAGGRVRLHVFVDWSSVEVFAADGLATITDQIFPSPASTGVALYSKGGSARLVSLVAWPLASAWTPARARRLSSR
jgi:fructan beta-fructosidase